MTPSDAPEMARPGSASVRMPRGGRSFTAFLVALVATAICAFVAVEAIWLAVTAHTVGFDVHAVTRYGRDTGWQNGVVLAAGIVGGLVGLVLLLIGVLPPGRGVIELDTGDPRLAAGIGQPSLQRLIATQVTGIDGVSAARVRGRRRMRILATTVLRDTTGLAEAIHTVAVGQLDALRPSRRRTVRVRLASREP